MHKTKNLEDGYMGSGKLIRRAIEKHGVENFIKEIIHVFDNEEDMKNKEKELVILNEMSYNLCDGGKGGFGYINKTPSIVQKRDSIENKKKGYAANKHNMTKPKNVNPENISKAVKKYYSQNKSHWTGKKHSDKTIAKMKLKAIGRNSKESNPNYGKYWITNGSENKMIKKDQPISDGWVKGRIIKV